MPALGLASQITMAMNHMAALSISHQKELLRRLWVGLRRFIPGLGFRVFWGLTRFHGLVFRV